MPRKIPWPKAPYVALPQPAANMHGKQVEYTEVNAGRGPFSSVGRLHVGKANARGKYPVWIVFTLHDEEKNFEHAVALQQEHVDSIEISEYSSSRSHFCCRRVIKS